MKVGQLMTRDVKCCKTADTLNRAAGLMWESDCGSIPVVADDDSRRVVGFITDRDIAMAAYTQGRALWDIPVATAMANKVLVCHARDGISQAESLMRDHQIRRLPVLDEDEHLVGVLSLNDVAREARREEAGGRRLEVTAEGVAETLASICRPRTAYELAVAA
ncbi:MAG TPA: CBS domain-containing protein [Candidatus Binataceae bacterium]|nr:CBS domain-containing protein [Candidatus Binataceae bacterium]